MQSNNLAKYQSIFTVLELKQSITPNDLQLLQQRERDYFETLPFVSKDLIAAIKREMQTAPPDKILAVYPNNLIVSFSPTSITAILDMNEKSHQLPKPDAVFIFLNIITVLYFDDITIGELSLIPLLRSFEKCVTSFQGLSTLFFQNLLNTKLPPNCSTFSVEFFNLIIDFININATVDGTFYPTFISIIQNAFAKNDHDLTMSIFGLLTRLFIEKRSLMKKEDQTLLLQVLTPFIEQEDANAFTVLSFVSHQTKCEAIGPIYSNLAIKMKDKLSKYPITISNQNKCDALPAVESNSRDPYSFLKKERKSFPSGFSSIPAQLFSTYDAQQHFTHDIWSLIDKVIELIKSSSSEISNKFFTTFFEQIKGEIDQDTFYSYLIFILCLLKSSPSSSRISQYYDILISSKVFDPNYVVFNDGLLDPIINYLRKEVVDLLMNNDIKMLMEIMVKKHLYLFVEFLGRLIATESKLSELSSFKTFFEDINDVSSYLQSVDHQYELEKIPIIRSTIFVFLSVLAKYPSFLQPTFIKAFPDFLFESELTDEVLRIIEINFSLCKNPTNYQTITEKLSSILDTCIYRSNGNKEYSQLAFKIARVISKSLRYSMHIVELAYHLFEPLYSIFSKNPTDDFLYILLSIIYFISEWKENFSLGIKQISFISEFMKKENLYSKKWYMKFLSILTNRNTISSVDFHLNTFYFIERQQFILMFLAVFGSTPEFSHYLEILSNNAQLSPYTARNLHDGCLDTVLLKFLATGQEECTIVHREISMNLKIPTKVQKKFVYPLLIAMLSAKTSYSVVALLHKLCQSKRIDFLPLYEAAMANCAIRHTPYHMISSLPVDIRASANYINNTQFSFTFWFNLDMFQIIRTRPEITFFTISDKNSSFSVKFIPPNSMLLEYESPKGVDQYFSSYKLIEPSLSPRENIQAVNSWHFFGLSLTPNQKEGIMAMNLLVDKTMLDPRPRTKQIPIFTFQKGKLDIKLGLVKTKEPQRCRELGYISEFKYHPWFLNIRELLQLSSNCPPAKDVSLDVASKTSFFQSKTLLEIYEDPFVMNEFMRTLRDRVNRPDFLYTLKYLLSSPYQSLTFSMTDDVLDCVLLMENRDSSLYLTVYSIFEVLTDENLMKEWLDTLIFNIRLWMRCPSDSKYIILCHWTSTLLQNYSDLFKSKSIFAQTFIAFEYLIKADEVDCRFEYIKLLTKLAFIYFTDTDASKMIDVLVSSYQKSSFKYYLLLIRNIASILSHEQRNTILKYLHHILEKDVECRNTHDILLSIHDLGSYDNDALESTILFRQLPRTHIVQCKLLSDLLENIDDFIYFYPLMCALAINMDEKTREDVAKKILEAVQAKCEPNEVNTTRARSGSFAQPTQNTQITSTKSQNSIATPLSRNRAPTVNSSSPNNSPRQSNNTSNRRSSTLDITVKISVEEAKKLYPNMWYIWPVLLAIKLKGSKAQNHVFEFLALATSQLPSSSDKIDAVQSITHLLSYISCGMSIDNLSSKYLISMHNKLFMIDTSVVAEIINQLVYSNFFRLSPHSHNSLLQKAYLNSVFYKYNPNIHYTLGSSFPQFTLNSLEELDAFATSRATPKIGFEHIFDERETYAGFGILQIALLLITEAKMKYEYNDILQYYAKPSKTGICNNYLKQFDQMKAKYANQFTNVTGKLFTNLAKFLQESRSKISQAAETNIEKIESRTQTFLIAPTELKPKPQMTNMLDYIRSRVMSPNYPGKIKNTLVSRVNHKKVIQQPKRPDVLVKDARLINIKKTRRCDLYLYRDSILIIVEEHVKNFSMKDIQHIYLFDSSFEFITVYGRSYFVDTYPQNIAPFKDIFNSSLVEKPDVQHWTSNFEYLMHLNLVSGRSFNKINCYPIFPNVLANSSDFLCRNIAGITVEGKIQPPDANFIRWGKPFYNMMSYSVSNEIERSQLLVPEYFYFAELFSNARYPDWASTNFEFVYKMRKLLERPSVTQNLPKFIDKIWGGLEFSKKFDHKSLFPRPHPPKPQPKDTSAIQEDSLYKLIDKGNVIFSHHCGKYLSVVTDEPTIYFFIVSIIKGNLTFSRTTTYKLKNEISKYYFFSSNENLFVFNKDTMTAKKYFATSNQLDYEKIIHCEYPQFSEFARTFFYCEDLSTIRLEGQMAIRSENEIICFTANQKFNILAYATSDNVLHIRNLPSLNKSENSARLPGIPQRILITEAWGFIVVQTVGNLTILTQNGICIKTISMNYDINYWTTFRSASGFDYIIFRHSLNNIYMFEVMYPDKIVKVCESHNLLNAFFMKDHETLLMVDKLGQAKLKHISFDTMFQ